MISHISIRTHLRLLDQTFLCMTASRAAQWWSCGSPWTNVMWGLKDPARSPQGLCRQPCAVHSESCNMVTLAYVASQALGEVAAWLFGLTRHVLLHPTPYLPVVLQQRDR